MQPNDDVQMWDLRRRNLSALIAYNGMKPSQVSREAGMSVNTLSKFLRGETKTLRWSTLEKLCQVLNLPTAAILDNENPFSKAKIQLYELVKEMSEDEAKRLVEELSSSGRGC